MHRSEEFLMSDDSDVPELDLPSTGRQENIRLFRTGKLPQDSVAKARKYCSSKCFLMLLLTSIVIAIGFLGISHVRLLNQLEGIIVLPRQLQIVEDSVRSMKFWNVSIADVNITTYGKRLDELIKQVDDLAKRLETLAAKIDKLKCCEYPDGTTKGSEKLQSITTENLESGKTNKRKRSKTGGTDDKVVVFQRVYSLPTV